MRGVIPGDSGIGPVERLQLVIQPESAIVLVASETRFPSLRGEGRRIPTFGGGIIGPS